MSVVTLPLKWRVRAKSCDASAKDAFVWAADELEAANAAAYTESDECRRVLNSDKPEYQKMTEIRAILLRNP